MKVIEALASSLKKAGKFNKAVQAQPEAILWTDAEHQWAPVVRTLQTFGLDVFTLGDYNADELHGPAVWLKCVLAGCLEDAAPNDTPIVYLPGVSRADLRAIESCPRHLQPLAELQYRGSFWTQVNAKDWTLNAFLASKNGGLGLDVAQDAATQKALMRALNAGLLMEQSLENLQGRLIDAVWLDGLLAPNPTRDVLAWMNSPKATRAEWEGGRWDVFVSRCRKDYQFDPNQDGELSAAEKLASRGGKWQSVWELYEDAYSSFPALVALLSKVQRAGGDLFSDASAYPAANEDGESSLRGTLQALKALKAEDARASILRAESEHGERRDWLWARMGMAPLANALGHLSCIAERTSTPMSGKTPEHQADIYANAAWEIDAEALRALAAVSSMADQDAVSSALDAVYVPWLEASARNFQNAVAEAGGLSKGTVPTASDPNGTCVVFVDGLRYDVARMLGERLDRLGKVSFESGWTSLPTVTASGKAWVSPVADLVAGHIDDADFEPNVAATGKPLNIFNFRKLLIERGYEPTSEGESGDAASKAWVECGDLDHFGHQHGLRLARDVANQLTEIVERIQALSEAGWRRFRIVTDHGWLLVPGGLPKAELAKSQVETRWGRCAVLKDTATAAPLTFGWDWCQQVQVGYAPGIASFVAGNQYAHGGMSLQECLVPEILLEIEGGTATSNVSVTKLAWRGLRCHVEVSPELPGLRADIRTKAAVEDSSIAASMKEIVDGKASLAVPDDAYEGVAAVIVIVDSQGNLVAKTSTTVGE